MRFFLISVLLSGIILGTVTIAMAEVQDKNMDWMQEARNQEIPVDEKIPVQQMPAEKESGMPSAESRRAPKSEMKSFDPFASDKPDVQSSQNQWQQSPSPSNTSAGPKGPTSTPDEKLVKMEENQTSILSFNLMLNWLNRFKSNQDMF
jgi:hypothetical protein